MSNGTVNLGDPPQKQQDPGFIPSPMANDPKAREKATQPDPGFILSPTDNPPESTGGVTGSWEEAGFFTKAWNRLTNPVPLINKEINREARGVAGVRLAEQKQIAAGHPVRAGALSFEAGVDEDIINLARGMSSPISLGLSALSFGEALPFRIIQFGAGAAFGTQAVETLSTPKTKDENTADYLERQSMAASQLLLSAAGNYATVKDTAHTFLRNKLKMSDDLAGKVSDNVAKMTTARAKEAATIGAAKETLETKQRAIDTQKAQDINRAEQNLEYSMSQLEGQTSARVTHIERTIDEQTTALQDKLGKLDAQKAAIGRTVIADTAHTVAKFEAQFDTRFHEIGKSIPGAVSNAGDIRSIVSEEAQNHGVQPKEIPPTATAALPKEQGETRVFPAVSAEAMENLRSQGLIDSGEGLTFDQLTRVKNDLYNAAYANKDGAVRSVLFRSAERVSDMQEAAAKAAGKGAEYTQLKRDYMQFARGIGSSDVRDWLSAQTMAEQELSGKISQFIRPSNAAALRSILRSVGIDTTDFDRTLEDIRTGRKALAGLPRERRAMLRTAKEGVPEAAGRETETAKEQVSQATAAAKEATKAARGEAATAIRGARTEREAAVKEAEAKGEIVPGRTTSELAGKTNEQLLRERLQSTADRMKGSGIMHPWRLILIGVGLMDMVESISSGHAFGFYRGAAYVGAYMAPSAIPEIVKNPSFQDWVIRESGVEPSNKLLVNKLRSGIAGLYPYLRRAAKSQAPASAISLGQPPKKETQ